MWEGRLGRVKKLKANDCSQKLDKNSQSYPHFSTFSHSPLVLSH